MPCRCSAWLHRAEPPSGCFGTRYRTDQEVKPMETLTVVFAWVACFAAKNAMRWFLISLSSWLLYAAFSL